MNDAVHADLGAMTAPEAARRTAEIWADLAFDESVKAALRRDGVAVERLRLTGPSPFSVEDVAGNPALRAVGVAAGDADQRDALLALWQVHILKRLRDRELPLREAA